MLNSEFVLLVRGEFVVIVDVDDEAKVGDVSVEVVGCVALANNSAKDA